MPVVIVAVWVTSLVLILLSVLPLVRKQDWWIRVWDYPRLQLAAALGASALLQLAILPKASADFILMACTLAALARHLTRIFPYTKLSRVQTLTARENDGASAFSLVVANVLQRNRNAAGFLNIVEQSAPDMLIIVETDAWWDAQLVVLNQRFPFVVRQPQDNTYGMMLLSRFELVDVEVRYRVADHIPSVFAVVRLPNGDDFDLYAVHPEPPQPGNDTEERDAELLMVAKEVETRERPAIVAGDLNDVAWSHTTRLFQRISRLLDPRVGRGMFATFHAEHFLARWPLDHIFHSPEFQLHDLRVLPYFGSDHFPFLVRLSYRDAAKEERGPDRAGQKDHEEVADKITAGKQAAAQS